MSWLRSCLCKQSREGKTLTRFMWQAALDVNMTRHEIRW